MNLFLYFKDPAFFETYIKSFIKNKMEKSFIDYFLLKDEQQLRLFSESFGLSTLNVMEKVLLILYLK